MPSSVDLGKTLEAVVDDLVKTGRYNSRSEVMREGVRLVQEREQATKEREQRLAVFDAAIMRGIADADAGRVKDADEVLAELVAKLSAMPEPGEGG